ncbi:MAG: PEP-CTERM sorting domain-containing protein [Betaproteobacteria bacterium]|nr:PEP-CTERM sorting domain-containing protein [Betaproteobacteria bacterium]
MESATLTACALAVMGLFAVGSAQATPVTFFGEDGNPTGSTPIAHPNSDAAQASFFANLTNIGTDGMDTVASGVTTVPVNFANGVTATLTGGTIQNYSSAGRFAISSPNYYNTFSDTFDIGFSSPIAAFGFYATDIGDFGGQLTLTLTDINNAHTSLTVPNLIGSGGSQPENGSVLYYGFYDTGDTYTNVTFGNSSGGVDGFGFDNFSVGTASQVVPRPTVPEPPSIALLGVGLVALSAVRRRRA